MQNNSYWLRQVPGKPLFPDLLWSRPENKTHAGKLLIIGGNAHGFAAPAQAYSAAEKAGIGSSRVLLPAAIQKSIQAFLPEAIFAPSTPSGSFALKSLDVWLENSEWGDGVILAGDLGRNSETTVALQSFTEKYTGLLTYVGDASDYAISDYATIAKNPGERLLVVTIAQLQKLAISLGSTMAVTSSMGLVKLVEVVHALAEQHSIHILTIFDDTIVVASGDKVSTTKTAQEADMTAYASSATVWWLQHPLNLFEAVTTSVNS